MTHLFRENARKRCVKNFQKILCAIANRKPGSRQHIACQLLPALGPQLFPDMGLVPSDGGDGHAHVGGDLLGGPVLDHQHGHGELRSGEIVRHRLAGIRVVDVPPPLRETVGDVDDALEVLRLPGLDDAQEKK